MEIENQYKGRIYKMASVIGAEDKESAIAFVMEHFNETPERLHDFNACLSSDGVFVVTLWTD